MNIQQYHRQQELTKYFAEVWALRSRDIEQFKFSGPALIGMIGPGEHVIDVGCGMNPFKYRISNLVGIDPAFDEADFKMTLEEYVAGHSSQRFNVAFCLGSINFGDRAHIERQIELVVRLLHTRDSRIFWRCNPGVADHGNEECNAIEFFPWTFELHHELAAKFGFDVMELEWDTNNRIYASWASKNKALINHY
jgi:hypothetical protein